MVTVVNYKPAINADGQEFFMLIVQGGVESVLSKESGRFYLTAKKASVSSTFDERTCESLIGTKMPGGVEKVEVEPYSYVVQETGEEITLNHRYQYNPHLQSMEEAVFGEQPAQELQTA